MDGWSIDARELTDLVPRRGLTHQEAVTLVELQAEKLLWLGGVPRPPVPVRQLVHRSGIAVEREPSVRTLGMVVPFPVP
jgi:hypothetical protein